MMGSIAVRRNGCPDLSVVFPRDFDYEIDEPSIPFATEYSQEVHHESNDPTWERSLDRRSPRRRAAGSADARPRADGRHGASAATPRESRRCTRDPTAGATC